MRGKKEEAKEKLKDVKFEDETEEKSMSVGG